MSFSSLTIYKLPGVPDTWMISPWKKNVPARPQHKIKNIKMHSIGDSRYITINKPQGHNRNEYFKGIVHPQKIKMYLCHSKPTFFQQNPKRIFLKVCFRPHWLCMEKGKKTETFFKISFFILCFMWFWANYRFFSKTTE